MFIWHVLKTQYGVKCLIPMVLSIVCMPILTNQGRGRASIGDTSRGELIQYRNETCAPQISKDNYLSVSTSFSFTIII